MENCPGLTPRWVPRPVCHYLDHVEGGCSLQALARRAGCHASTILRQVRRWEQRRDDPLIDAALFRLGAFHRFHQNKTGETDMIAPLRHSPDLSDDTQIQREARRVLSRLTEPGALLVIGRDMEKAVVMRTIAEGKPVRVAVLDRPVAEAFALKDWIRCLARGRVMTYTITPAGRAAFRRMCAADEAAPVAGHDAPSPFAAQQRETGTRKIHAPGADAPRRIRCNMAESPLSLLARRKDREGRPFLSTDLVVAGERLREDFEIAQMGPRVTQNWDRFLTGADRGGFNSGSPQRGPAAARERVAAALRDLGPGLGDVVLRCCCFLEGMEETERHMGWSARSGKIVLRIALQRLKRHYERQGEAACLIG
ncbi:hypothetical protein C8N32_10523 [Rhodovulum imhoffii]|uniref:DUF6456 domain-containing protein n=1 Tax=Rhodovulum imhoffii TaxID=365340 RepID=A0A2T5BTA0_9RHOB|nr:DUF6456 domain-containing protein [Rhodovulum imhoffii]MBK5932984.1 helix-turn-helix domain containing protein [Rhodovulum imhoffii]PTN02653.1 hypothetical protein C8N32_10523 [Rhodovulum imhoffii]